MFNLRRKSPIQKPTSPPIRGVNLGGWLVLEKWITPSLFRGVQAIDEHSLCSLPHPAIPGMIHAHRSTFITRQDFVWLKQQGIDSVRLPVGYWVFGEESPYYGAIDFVDKAFERAQDAGLTIMLDFHGAPGSQNGWDHSGHSGTCGWHTDEQNIIKSLSVVDMLAKRYGNNPQLLGIELLNEPHPSVPRGILLRYYESAYRIIRDNCLPGVWVVFHDSFRPRRWKHKLRGKDYTNLYIDTHQYQTFSSRDKRLDVAGHVRKTVWQIPRLLARMARRHPVIVGEWSLALDKQSLGNLDEQQTEAVRRTYGSLQLLAYQQAAAWYYWTYRTEQSGAPNVWSFRDCIDNGWLPPFR